MTECMGVNDLVVMCMPRVCGYIWFDVVGSVIGKILNEKCGRVSFSYLNV